MNSSVSDLQVDPRLVRLESSHFPHIIYLYLFLFMHICVWEWVYALKCRLPWRPEAGDPLELDLQVVVCYLCMLGTELISSERVTSSPKS